VSGSHAALNRPLFSGMVEAGRREVAMPANLPPQYHKAEEEFKNARTIPERIAALEVMMAVMPHHKGTDKLRAELNRKMSQLKEQTEALVKGRHPSIFAIERQGAAQVVLVGPPNTGKSSILGALTAATPLIADYPFTTTQPEVGMMPYDDIQIQIVDCPPMEGDVRKLAYYNLLRTADALILVANASGEPDAEVKLAIEELAAGKIYSRVAKEEPPIGSVIKKMLIVLNKCDAADAGRAVRRVRESVANAVRVVAVSAMHGSALEDLKEEIYRVVEIIRVYTKIPGTKPDLHAPFVLSAGSTVMDLARSIHRDFAEGLRYARIWGSGKFDGQSVQRDHVLENGDVIELHI
jgi:ribosome-interacting GTPase 1